MRYDVGRFRRPMRRSTEGQLMSLISLGDGSTLSLDFTTGVLDPRLTFTRLGNATFINSSGLVQWAAANEFRNTGWVTSTTPTGWNVTFGTGTTTWNNDGTLTMNTGGSSTRPCINANSFTVSQGIAYTFGYTVVSVSGSPQITSVISSTLVGDTFAINGTTVSGTEVVKAGDVVSCTFTPTGTTAIPRMGPGVNAGMTNTAMTITRPQMNPGLTLQPYLLNTSTSVANNNTPRFDYDPTSIGTPRGLLIEGAATNVALNSETFPTSGTGQWGYSEITANVTKIVGPDNTTNAIQFNETTNNAIHRISQGMPALAAGAASISVWAKVLNTGTPRRLFLNATAYIGAGALFDLDPAVQTGSSGSAVAVGGTAVNRAGTWVKYPNGWYRCTVVGTYATAASIFLQINRSTSTTATDETFAGSTSNGLSLWGVQVESGSGASSYIPTVASTATRNADECSMTGTNFSSWFNATEGAFLAHARRMRTTDVGRIASANDNTANESIDIGASTTGQFIVTDGGSALATITPGTVTANTAFKIAGAFKLNDVQAALGGTLGTADTGVTMPTVNQLMIGRQAGASPVYLNGTVSLIKFWPTRLPDSQLQSLTT